MSGQSRRFPWLGHVIAFCLIGVFSMSPVIWLSFANAQNAGMPVGLAELMAGWGVLGWLVMTPFVLGPLLFLLWAIVFVIHLLTFLRGRRTAR